MVMDSQHKMLIEIINELHEAMLTQKGNQEVGLALDRMMEYTQRHFRDEERILAANQYPLYAYQKSQHDAFILKVQEFKHELQQGKLTLSIQVSKFLKDWLINHIQGEDKKYGIFLNSKGIK
jgi:hemerythrin